MDFTWVYLICFQTAWIQYGTRLKAWPWAMVLPTLQLPPEQHAKQLAWQIPAAQPLMLTTDLATLFAGSTPVLMTSPGPRATWITMCLLTDAPLVCPQPLLKKNRFIRNITWNNPWSTCSNLVSSPASTTGSSEYLKMFFNCFNLWYGW